MQLFNRYGPMLAALGFVNDKPGDRLVQVMPDVPEEIYGPVFMRDELGRVVSRYSIPGCLTILASGKTDLERGFVVMPPERQIIYSWVGIDSVSYKVIIKDYRKLDNVRRA